MRNQQNRKNIKAVDSSILYSIITLGLIGAGSAAILYWVASKFKVEEDPRIDAVAEALPQANCGGCGYAGCRNFAEAIVKTGSLDNLICPVGGDEVMKRIASILGLEVPAVESMIAIVRCNGSFQNSPSKFQYDGVKSCAFAHITFTGEGGCPYGCLGHGDCERACTFDAIHINPATGLPEVNDKCTACGACVKACPRNIIEMRPRGKKDRRIYVTCMNKEKGAVARKNCEVACIGCNKCVKECRFDAITLSNNLAYIDPHKCTLCRKCVEVCPTNCILEVNLPPRKRAAQSDSPAEITA